MMVPLPSAATVNDLNASLLASCDALLAEPHYRTKRTVDDMFDEDRAAMLPLPRTPFDAVRWVPRVADKDGRVELDGVRYLAGAHWHGWHLMVGCRARTVEIRDERGRRIVRLPRKWRDDGKTVRDPASLVPPLTARPRAWDCSPLRSDVPEALRDAIDRADSEGRRQALRAIARATEHAGFAVAVAAANEMVLSGRLPEEGAVDVLARRIAQGGPAPSGAADLSVYDLLAKGGDR